MELPFIIDGHLDLAWNALALGRDPCVGAVTFRTHEGDRQPAYGAGRGTVGFPDMRRGRVALCFATLFARSTGTPVPFLDYPTPAHAYAVAQGQLAYYRALHQQGAVRILTDLASLNRHLATWAAAHPVVDSQPIGIVLAMEGADPIRDPDQLTEWWSAGLRLLGLTHYGPGRYAGGTGSDLGLTDLGSPLLAAMEQIGVVLDVSHCSDRSFWQALDHYGGPVLASHSNCRALVPHPRQIDDDQIRALIARDGVVGVALDAWMLQPGWTVGRSTNEALTLMAVADHIDHICQLAGTDRHAAIGSDLDGGFGTEQTPGDLNTIADLQSIADILARRGYQADAIKAIMHGNWLRLLHRAWGRGSTPRYRITAAGRAALVWEGWEVSLDGVPLLVSPGPQLDGTAIVTVLEEPIAMPPDRIQRWLANGWIAPVE